MVQNPFGFIALPPSDSDVDFRAKVTAIYQQYNPGKLADSNFLDTIMVKYKGKEPDLIKLIEKKYNVPVEPGAQSFQVSISGPSSSGASSFGAPAATFGAPSSNFGATPSNSFGSSWGATFGAPASNFGAPAFNAADNFAPESNPANNRSAEGSGPRRFLTAQRRNGRK